VPTVTYFADGEMKVTVPTDSALQGKHVCLVQTVDRTIHESLMQTLFIAHALCNSNVQSITLMAPYCLYARHDSASQGESPFAGIMRLLHAAGITALITVELHNPSIAKTLPIPVHSLSLVQCIADHIRQTFPCLDDILLIAPDFGAHERVVAIAGVLGVSYGSFTKKRHASDGTHIITDNVTVLKKTAIIIDDIIDTGSTALNVCKALYDRGCRDIYGYFVHPVLSHGAQEKIEASQFTTIFVSDSIPLAQCVPKIKKFAIAKAISEQILNNT
jgi:ribose-phosphate pyrophosphokinase